MFGHYLHGLLFKGITFLESHLFSETHPFLLLPNPLSPASILRGFTSGGSTTAGSEIDFYFRGCWMLQLEITRVVFSPPLSPLPLTFFLFPLLSRKDFAVVRTVNRGNSKGFIRQTINCASISPGYELAQQVTAVIKSILCTTHIIKMTFLIRELECILYLLVQTFPLLFVFLSFLLLYNFSLFSFIFFPLCSFL